MEEVGVVLLKDVFTVPAVVGVGGMDGRPLKCSSSSCIMKAIDDLELEKVGPLGLPAPVVMPGAKLGRFRTEPLFILRASVNEASLLRVRRGGRGKMTASLPPATGALVGLMRLAGCRPSCFERVGKVECEGSAILEVRDVSLWLLIESVGSGSFTYVSE